MENLAAHLLSLDDDRAFLISVPSTIEECENDNIHLHPLHIDDDDDDDDDGTSSVTIFFRNDSIDNDDQPEARTNTFWKNLARTQKFQHEAQYVNAISFGGLHLDEWETLSTTLTQQHRARPLEIDNFELSFCHFTDRGARFFANMLKTQSTNNDNNTANNTFCIKTLVLIGIRGSTAWIDGLLENKTITNLALSQMPILYSALQFIQNSPRLKEVDLCDLSNGEGRAEEETLSLQCQEIPNLQALAISFTPRNNNNNEPYPVAICRGIGSILRQTTNLQTLRLQHFQRNLPYDFLKDAIHCNKLDLFRTDFDPLTVASLVKGHDNHNGGNIRSLCLDHVDDLSNAEHLLQLVDLTSLDSFQIHADNHSTFIDALCHQLANNKGGPKRLVIRIAYADFVLDVNTGSNADLSDLLSRLASSLVGNDKIEDIVISGRDLREVDLEPQQELVKAMGTMPRLKSWRVESNFGLNDSKAKIWKEWIVRQLESNWNIQTIYPPFAVLGDGIEEMLVFNKQRWRTFFSCHDKLSSGVWSLALSQIKSTPGSMYRVVREVPSLFQQVADVADERDSHRLPSFAVPHHPNCPGCHMNKKQHA